MKNKGLTMSLIIEVESANYGEGFGNISSLKKLSRGNGETYSYISRQALRYNIVEQMGCNNTPVEANGKGDKKVIQFHPDATIIDYPEIDLFGYMKTEAGSSASTRNAVVRISNAIALESYKADTDFLTNMGLAKRNNEGNAIAQSEIHKSYYSYTITVDLDKVGIDGEQEISKEEKIKRIKDLLKTIQFLYRDIRGRRENLSPLFVIGGVYDRKNPYFENRLKIKENNLEIQIIEDIINSDEDIKNNTNIGIVNGIFKNSEDINTKLNAIKTNEVFEKIIKEVEAVYSEGN